MKKIILENDGILICSKDKEIVTLIQKGAMVEMPECKDVFYGTIEEAREKYPEYKDLTQDGLQN